MKLTERQAYRAVITLLCATCCTLCWLNRCAENDVRKSFDAYISERQRNGQLMQYRAQLIAEQNKNVALQADLDIMQGVQWRMQQERIKRSLEDNKSVVRHADGTNAPQN